MFKMVGEFEVETVQEIWRTEDLTFTIFYVSKEVCYVKGMRGTTPKNIRSTLKTYLKDSGVKTMWFERKDSKGNLILKKLEDKNENN